MEVLIKNFLKVDSGYGLCYSSGYSSGDGPGGSGYGSGIGSGYGLSYGLKTLNGEKISHIDNIHTIIRNVKGQIASGFIVNNDLTLTPCFIARVGNYFAHGDTIREALADATAKFNGNRPLEDRIADFAAKFKKGESYPASELKDWHKILTGACQFGQREFIKSREVDLEVDRFTIKEFIRLTEDQYGGEIIRSLKQYYN